MKKLLLVLMLFIAQVAQADLLSESLGQWEGQGVLESGMKWPIYVKFLSQGAEVYTPDDGCEADWTFGTVTDGILRGWEHVTVGIDRCYVGLEFVVTRYDDYRLKVEWYLPNGMFVAEALLWRVQ